eukprot:TRINITY_DN11308_c1_g1_i2.p1 TRINITY_DN11308_c1_g1~~TRINITY_DN11308_c1_g1_i2.p1  ORF type:complete len:485 (+),score=134.05 TRINITY_DN11308_c1_g1_i2:94-1548(+)
MPRTPALLPLVGAAAAVACFCFVLAGDAVRRAGSAAHPQALLAASLPPRRDAASATIFISVAAYRDAEVNMTLRSLFQRAAHPRRLFVGLICQAAPGKEAERCAHPADWDRRCAHDEWCPMDQIRSRIVDAQHSKGPTFARFLASQLYRGEDYFMMVDAHNVFVRQWDLVVLNEHANCASAPRCVLTTYPMAYIPENPSYEEPSVAYLCSLASGKPGVTGWTAGFPGPFWANSFSPGELPKPQPYLGAGLVFGPGSMVREVPFDPHLHYIFFGEEFLLGVRLWTAGYDLFSPSKNILYHHYGRRGPMSVGRSSHPLKAGSERRIQHILGLTHRYTRRRIVPLDTQEAEVVADLPKCGLGRKRSLWQYWEFARIDPVVQSWQTFKTSPWCLRYGPQARPDGEWRRGAQLEERVSAEWWQGGVAPLAVGPDYRPLPTPAPTPAPPTPAPAPGCRDEYPDCPGWKEAGECKVNIGMLSFCKASCGKC